MLGGGVGVAPPPEPPPEPPPDVPPPPEVPPSDVGLGAADGPVPPVGDPDFGGAVEGAGAGVFVLAVVAPGLPECPEPDD